MSSIEYQDKWFRYRSLCFELERRQLTDNEMKELLSLRKYLLTSGEEG